MADKKITVVYLFNRVRQGAHEAVEQGKDHDNHFFGMYRLSPFGFQGKYLELEQFLPSGFCRFIRQHLLSIHFVHLPAIYSIFKADVVFTSTAFGTLALEVCGRLRNRDG